MELTEFITARLDEDEAVAREVQAKVTPRLRGGVSIADYYEDAEGSSASAYFDRNYGQGGYTITAARALATVEAHRKIVALHGEGSNEGDCATCATSQWNGSPQTWALHPCPTLRALASIWSDHPAYDPAWEA